MESSTGSTESSKTGVSEQRIGIVFTKQDDTHYLLSDVSYGMDLGQLSFDEGPGWILDTTRTYFLDMSHMRTILKFVEELEDGCE